MKKNSNKRTMVAGSFRDPSGFIFYKNNSIYRQINHVYKPHYDHLINSNLYETLKNKKLLIPHEEIPIEKFDDEKIYKIINPQEIPFISYPYEWCFSQLKDAALITLDIQKQSLKNGMSLKDSSAYNIQFLNGKPILIDSLSFEKYRENEPWVAYKQFCQHFFAPLALMSYRDIQLNQLLQIYIDGIPLGLTNSLLPLRNRFNMSVLTHINLHSKSQKYFGNKPIKLKKKRMSKLILMDLIENLENGIKKLKLKKQKTEWSDYYYKTSYTSDAFVQKKIIVEKFINHIKPKTIWDMGANTGEFSRIGSNRGIHTIAFDKDPLAVEKNYQKMVKNKETNLLPLILDLTNPSPAIGWENRERMSLMDRGQADMIMALSLVHHLAISNNLPFDKIALFFSKLCNTLIIEFVPKKDPMTQRLLLNREDVYTAYTEKNFMDQFKKYFNIIQSENIINSDRKLLLMTKK